MESTLRRTWAEIDYNALKHNYNTLREHVGRERKFVGVVKADAYGHGAVQVGRWLQELGADYLAVSSIDEAMELRNHDISMPIIILGHTPTEQVSTLMKYNITQSVTALAKAKAYSREAQRLGGVLKIHIKIDSGMSRLGYLCEGEFFDTGVNGISETMRLPGLDVEGIFTHFAVSDEPGTWGCEYTLKQFTLFTSVINAAEERTGKKFRIRHCANTGAVANYPETWLDMVRPGLLLYGYGDFAKRLGLQPVMTLKSTVSTIKVYPEGTKISYGLIYEADRKTRVGVLPIGYADGFFRTLSNRCQVMTSDGPADQIGKICMDMCMINLNDKPNVDVGDEVEIFGKNNPIEKLAEIAGTIPYELTSAISKRVPRSYVVDGKVVYSELLLRGE